MNKFLTVLLTMSMLLGFINVILPTNASASEETAVENDMATDRAVSICYKCGGMVLMGCLDDMHYNRSVTHNSGTCTYDVYTSRSAQICSSCGNIDSISSGEHYCLERHRGCSKGDYYVCPCAVRP